MDNTAKALLLLTLAVSTEVAGDCHIREVVDENPCGGELSCDNNFSDAVTNIAQMPCLYIYMDYSEERALHQNFTITVVGTDFEFTDNDSSVISELKNHITAISITNGKITKFPYDILDLPKVTLINFSGNKIESLNLAAFSKLGLLNALDVSYNNVARLETVGPVSQLASINTMDLSHNKIQGAIQNAISPFVTLLHLNLSYNFIESFSDNEFNNLTKLQTLDISNNRIVQLGSSLSGLGSVENLLLDHNKITTLNKNNFYGMSALKYLNISENNLSSIESTSFTSLYALIQLDMSNNQIKVLAQSTFQNNSLLRYLDVSYNKISKIESGAFAGAHIETLKLHNNTVAGYLDTDAFNGLYFEKLDLSDAHIGELGPDLFGPHPTFQSLNFRRNIISKISKTTFRNLDRLVYLDISYNKLENIDFDTTDLRKLTHLYINNNDIEELRKATFEPLDALNWLDLSHNDIKYIETLAFKNLNKLSSLNLKDNPLSHISRRIFDGLVSCLSLDLSDTKITELKNNTFNGMTSLNTLNLSNSYIDLLEFNVFNGTGSIQFLDLSHNFLESFSINQTNFEMQKMVLAWNDITTVTKTSFKGLGKMVSLDISYNRILNIQPGSFRDCRILRDLKLNSNYLSFLQFGVFDGLQTVENIDLSNNKFHRVDGKLFYFLPNIETVYLDNNFIDKINFTEFALANIEKLSLGGNLIPCDALMSLERTRSLELRTRTMSLSVVARNREFDTENVNGIACKSLSELDITQKSERESPLAGNVYLEELVKLNQGTNQYLAANLGILFSAMLVALCIFVYFKFRSKLTLSRNVSSSREALSNAIELE